MAEKDIVTACLILIGNEILSGRTQDKNLNFLATGLNEIGIQMREARVIPDIEKKSSIPSTNAAPSLTMCSPPVRSVRRMTSRRNAWRKRSAFPCIATSPSLTC